MLHSIYNFTILNPALVFIADIGEVEYALRMLFVASCNLTKVQIYCPGLPDNTFDYQKYQFWYIFEGLKI
jgi:hypothetical protein